MRNIYISETKTENYWWSKINIIIYNNRISKIINLLDDTTNQPSKFRTRNWVEINDESRGKYDNSNIELKTSRIRSNLCDYSEAYILAKGTITVLNIKLLNIRFINCAPFTNCITEKNNTQVDEAEDTDIVMGTYNLIEYTDAYWKTSGSLWQYYRDDLTLDNNNNIVDFPANNNNSISFKLKQQITGKTENYGTKNVEIMVPLK